MHPILEIGLADTIDFSKFPSPQQQRRYQPHLVSAGPGRPHRRTVRLMASSPIRPSLPTTDEISPPRRRRRSSPKAKPVVGPGASAGKAVQQDTAEGENANPSRLSLTRLKQHESHERVCGLFFSFSSPPLQFCLFLRVFRRFLSASSPVFSWDPNIGRNRCRTLQ